MIPVGDRRIKMKKLIIFSSVVTLITLLLASPVLAIPGIGAVKGEVTEVDPDEGTMVVETKRGESVTVAVPEEVVVEETWVGNAVLVKGEAGEGNLMEADWIKQVGKGQGKGKGSDKGNNEDKAEGKKDNSAFCVEGKPSGHQGTEGEKQHPLAAEVAGRFEVDEGWVMETFCEGYGMGAIMLALKTTDLVDDADPEELLQERAQGQGWGQIWKDKGLIGSEKEGDSPPGQLKKAENANKGGKKDD
jgi:hypothetical protein